MGNETTNLTCSTITAARPIGLMRGLGIYKEQGVQNCTDYVIWLCDNKGYTTPVSPSGYIQGEDPGITIYVREDREAHTRSFDYTGFEKPKNGQGFNIYAYKASLADLRKKGHLYLNGLQISLAFTEDDAKRYHPHLEDAQALYRKQLLQQFTTAIVKAPIKIVINDSAHQLKEAWTVVNDFVCRVGILHDINAPDECAIYIGASVGNYAMYTIPFQELVDGKTIFPLGTSNKSIILARSQSEAEVQLTKIRRTDCIYTDKDVKEQIALALSNQQNALADMEAQLNSALIREKSLKDENAALRAQISQLLDLKSRYQEQLYKAQDHEYRRELGLQSLEKGKLGVEKEQISKSASDLSSIATIAKAASTLVPIVIGCIGIYGLFAGGAAKGICAGISSLCSLFS